MRHKSSVPFLLKLYMFWTKGPRKEQTFRLLTVCMKINQIPLSHFSSRESVFL